MQREDKNTYLRRARLINDLADQHPEHLAQLDEPQREILEDYFLGALQAADPDEYRVAQLKTSPTRELQANKAYERFLAVAGVPETLAD